MGRAAHDLIGDADRIHDVERQQRDVRRLEHVAAGVEHEIGFLAGRGLIGALAQPRQQRVVELHLRNMLHLDRDLAEGFDAVAALRHGLLGVRHLDARHIEQEARIDAVVASLDAFAGEEAPTRPFARGLVAVAVAHDVDDAVDDVDGILPLLDRQARGLRGRANLDAFAATGAGIRHGVGARFQGGLERCGLRLLGHSHKLAPNRARLKAMPSRCKPYRCPAVSRASL